jgi:uncharacterized lipoprotein YmbA
MSSLRTGWWMIGCANALVLAGCHSAPTRLHGLDPTEPAARVHADQAPALRIDAVNVPAAWDRSEILRPSPAGTLEVSDFDHWSAPLAQMARQTLSDDLDRRLPSGTVIYPRLPKPDGALGIDVDILEFTVAASQASMRASWLILPAGHPGNAKRSVALLQGTMISTEPAAVVRAWSELIGRLADRIAADAASLKAP